MQANRESNKETLKETSKQVKQRIGQRNKVANKHMSGWLFPSYSEIPMLHTWSTTFDDAVQIYQMKIYKKSKQNKQTKLNVKQAE